MSKFDPMRLTDHQARQWLEALRWPKGAICPRCKKQEVTDVGGGREGLYNCRRCRRQFTVTVGTIFEGSHIPLSKWVQAFHLICASKKGISALQLSRMLGITYKSAWHMAHRIRYVMKPARGTPPLSGTVEVDETYVGGKGSMKTRSERQTPLVALVQRDGSVRTKAVKSVSTASLLSAIQQHVAPAAEVMTDELKAYGGVKRYYDQHQTVTHSKREWARGAVHTNTVESFFALMKRGIHGSYHHVSKKHLQRYGDEFAFRWSQREVTDKERTESALRQVIGRRLPYQKLTGQN